MKYFYSKYIIVESLVEEMHTLDLSDDERHHLAALVDSQLHHAILDEILSNLSEKDKELFLDQMNEDPENENIMDFLKGKVDNIEEKIRMISDKLVKELHSDVKEAKRIK